MTTLQYEQNCSIMRFVALFSGKWVLPIVYHLIEAKHPVRFSQLQKALAPIPQKELSKHLKLLEQHQLITKQIYPEVPPRVEYQITELGQTLQSAIQSLGSWMELYEKNINEK